MGLTVELEERSSFYWTVRRLDGVAQEDGGGLCWPHAEGTVPLFSRIRKSQGHFSFLTGDEPDRTDHGQDGHWPKNFRDK